MSQNSDKPAEQGGPSDETANRSPSPKTENHRHQNVGDPGPGAPDRSPPPGSEAESEFPSAEYDGMPEDAVAALNAQVEDLTKRLLVAHADIQNLHKRFDRERQETAKFAITKFARDTVAVADNFERAITSVPDGATDDNPVLKALLDGVTMTEREFLNVLERHGVKRVEPKGQIFNPHRHQAVMEQNDPSVTSGTILQVFQPGYEIEDRVLRPAMVTVAKGGPKPAKDTDEPTSSDTAPDDDTATE